ncbi:MAG: hypothetical protein HY873_06015 [Chloroflexi bacterium]|nr:hypothetical protein [Chloroflexota bacterium]
MVTKRTPAKEPPRRREPQPKKEPLSLWERLAAIGARIPTEDRADHPRDGARNLEHYLYGAPRED